MASPGTDQWIWNPNYHNYYRVEYVNGQPKYIWAELAQSPIRRDSVVAQQPPVQQNGYHSRAQYTSHPYYPSYTPQPAAAIQNTSYLSPTYPHYVQNRLSGGGSSYPTHTGSVAAGNQHQPLANTSQPREGDPEELNRSYRVRMSADKFFIKGKVFAVLFHESCGHTVKNLETDSNISRVKYGEYVYSQIRRFVVVQERHGFCNACPIYTYGERATTKPGVDAAAHGIIYTATSRAEIVPGEDEGVRRRAIRLQPVDSGIALSVASRIHYGKPHPIEHNVKVKDLGNIHPEDIMKLLDYWRKAQDD